MHAAAARLRGHGHHHVWRRGPHDESLWRRGQGLPAQGRHRRRPGRPHHEPAQRRLAHVAHHRAQAAGASWAGPEPAPGPPSRCATPPPASPCRPRRPRCWRWWRAASATAKRRSCWAYRCTPCTAMCATSTASSASLQDRSRLRSPPARAAAQLMMRCTWTGLTPCSWGLLLLRRAACRHARSFARPAGVVQLRQAQAVLQPEGRQRGAAHRHTHAPLGR
jgi:hypothetical protein